MTIASCSEHHVARAAAKPHDGNQIMWQLLQDITIFDPALEPKKASYR